MYRVIIDREACAGVFACLTRDERFVEDDDGLATLEGESDDTTDSAGDGSGTAEAEATPGGIETTDRRVIGEFDDERVADARQAAAACPFDAIAVTAIDGGEEA